jgi:hypothetical protein
MPRLTHLSVIICAIIVAATFSASGEQDEPRKCTTNLGGQVVCGDLLGLLKIGIQGITRKYVFTSFVL